MTAVLGELEVPHAFPSFYSFKAPFALSQEGAREENRYTSKIYSNENSPTKSTYSRICYTRCLLDEIFL